MNRLCTICARAGSKGVVGKNLRLLHGKPLIAYSIQQAKASGLFQAIAVDSDSEQILETAREWGADYQIRRPDELATDKAAKLPAIRHCVIETEKLTGQTFDVIIDLDATSPLRIPQDILQCVHLLEERGVSNVITGAPARRSPYFNLVEVDEDGIVQLSKNLDKPVVRRQDAPQCYDMNASIYAWTRKSLLFGTTLFNPDTLIHVMPEERSIDIDSELDFRIVEMIMQTREGVTNAV